MIAPRVVFADTSFYIAVSNPRDQWHGRAIEWFRLLVLQHARFLTTEAALWEFLNSSTRPALRQHAYAAYLRLRRDPATQVLAFDANLIQRAVTAFGARPDKEWSVTDCLSILVMEERGIIDALTSDHHFEQAGFTALLNHDPQP